jgi:hypothetical protein
MDNIRAGISKGIVPVGSQGSACPSISHLETLEILCRRRRTGHNRKLEGPLVSPERAFTTDGVTKDLGSTDEKPREETRTSCIGRWCETLILRHTCRCHRVSSEGRQHEEAGTTGKRLTW